MKRDFEDYDLEAPAELIATLRESLSERIFVPPTVDDVVLREAQQHLNQPEPRRFRWRRLSPWLATGALFGLIALSIYLSGRLESRQPQPLTFNIEDLNHDGRVDILDAFVLARQLKSSSRPDPQLDINGDGIIDERDVEAIAIHAVKVEYGGRS